MPPFFKTLKSSKLFRHRCSFLTHSEQNPQSDSSSMIRAPELREIYEAVNPKTRVENYLNIVANHNATHLGDYSESNRPSRCPSAAYSIMSDNISPSDSVSSIYVIGD